ncbi:MAG: putative transposase YdaD [Paraglaciecola sp.]|jgi:predicted transposase YdaD
MLEVTHDFLSQIPPKEIRDYLDLSELAILEKSHINEALRKTESDLIFSAHLKTDIPIQIAILLEHKSNPSVHPHAQIQHYISSIHQQNIINSQPLIPVLPILFYHGSKRWTKRPFTDSFTNLPKIFHQYISTSEYILVNLADYIR